MSTTTHAVHDFSIRQSWDDVAPVVEIDGHRVDTAQTVDVRFGLDGLPTVTVTHACAAIVVAGVATIDHKCGSPTETDDTPTGYLAQLKVLLRDFASDVLIRGDVYGQRREEVLDQIEGNLDRITTRTAHAVLDGAPKVLLSRPEDLDGEKPPHTFLVISRVAVTEHDLEPGVHAVIRLPGGVA